MSFGKIKNILKSITINKYSWGFIFLSVLLLDQHTSYIKKIITFFIISLFTYFAHRNIHCNDYSNKYFPAEIHSSIHLYHHSNNNFLSHFLQIILEFNTIHVLTILQHIFNINIVNYLIIWYFYIFYTLIHNVNYSIFHINNVHEIHHDLLNKNMGPDIFDIIFDTKHDPNNVENTDHYIFPAIIALIGTSIIEGFHNNPKYTSFTLLLFTILYFISVLIISFYTLIINNDNLNIITKEQMENIEQIKQIQKLYSPAKHIM